jgi:fluoride exporter
MMLKTIMLVGAGGFIGSVARYYVSKLNIISGAFALPVGTLLVNVLGSFVLGVLVGLAGRSPAFTQEWRLFMMVGLCGQFMAIAVYTGLSVFLGFLAVFMGYSLSKLI